VEGAGQVETFFGAGHAHVAEPPFLFKLVFGIDGPAVGQQALLHPHHEHHGELQSLGLVQGDQCDRIFSVLVAINVGHQRQAFQQGGQSVGGRLGVELLGGVAQFQYVFPAFLGPVIVVLDVAAEAGVLDDPESPSSSRAA